MSSKLIRKVIIASYAGTRPIQPFLIGPSGGQPALCLTDPPYGIGEAYVSHDDSHENLAALVDRFLPLVRDRCDVVLLTTRLSMTAGNATTARRQLMSSISGRGSNSARKGQNTPSTPDPSVRNASNSATSSRIGQKG
jgi:hypothetical protein